jgi:hypothetical protein
MPEIEFTIDAATGDITVQVTGVAGPACEDVTKLARELLGAPAGEQTTPEYFVRPRIQRQIRPGQGS